MKILTIGDIHGRIHNIEYVYENIDNYDYVVFIGDYVDSFDISDEEMLRVLRELIILLKMYPHKIIALLGNHDIQYIEGKPFICSGFRPHLFHTIGNVFYENQELFCLAKLLDNKLFTHAGCSNTWLNLHNEHVKDFPIDEQINEIYKNKPLAFNVTRSYNDIADHKVCGNLPNNSPIWIRPQSLLQDMAHPYQIVGHTQTHTPHQLTYKQNNLLLADSPDYVTVIENDNMSYIKTNNYGK